MHDPTNGHTEPLISATFAVVAAISDGNARTLTLCVALVALLISLVRFGWDWQDRHDKRAAIREAREQLRRDRP